MNESKFADIEDLKQSDFEKINKVLQSINEQYHLPDHTLLNKERFNNASVILNSGTYYGSRMWEYPYAILNAKLSEGMKVADIGCGSTPFTVYLSQLVGKNNVTGFDNDFLESDDTHFAFGIRKQFKENTGIQFKFSNINSLDALDNSFDCVFCISVLEHIEDPAVWQKGLMEMARIVKPGGRLILTFDFSIQHKYISIGDVLNYTGLIPANYLNMNWPEKRFVNVDGKAMDVFGITLTKQNGKINSNTMGHVQMDAASPFKTYIPEITSVGQVQIQKDLKRNKLLTVLKLLLNKYRI